MDYYLEYGGGLGDVLYQMYQNGWYNVLSEMGPDAHATVALISHNPHVRELFDYHPKARQIEVKYLGYWLPEDDGVMRERHGLPAAKPAMPASHQAMKFHPAPDDLPVLELLRGRRYVVFSVSAGLSERDLPGALVKALVSQAQARQWLPVFVGRNYNRHGRCEYRPANGDGLNLIDKLTVPGVACVIQDAAGVICCHSAINILAWLLRKRQLLLYPQSVYERHIVHRDQWAFGIG